MIVECIYNTGKVLVPYLRKPLGTSEITQFGELTIGEKYLVMGIMLVEGYLLYLIDSDRVINAFPYQLFKIVESELPKSWFFRAFTIGEQSYSQMEAVWGYKELCLEIGHYESLIEMDATAFKTYFNRKREFEQELDSGI